MYSEETEAKIRAWAESRIAPKRLAHVRGTVETADRLAQRYAPAHTQTVRLAAWLHDVARHWPPAELLAYAEAHSLPIEETERETPMLLHGAVGYALAAEHVELDDPLIQSACRFHTVGSASMNTTDKILFLADFIEPSRKYAEVARLRAEAEIGLDAAVLLAIDLTFTWFVEAHKVIDPRQLVLRNHLLKAGVRHS
jgi:predicted HD superfamily hydrolase involved in NAD metabolism